MKVYFRIASIVLLFVSSLVSINVMADGRRLCWQKKGKEAQVVLEIDKKQKKVIASGYDAKFKSPGPLKSGFLWEFSISDMTWGRRNDGSPHPVELIDIKSTFYGDSMAVKVYFSGNDGFDDVKYLFDDRMSYRLTKTDKIKGGIFFEVVRNGKKGIVGIFNGRPRLVLTPEYDKIELAGFVHTDVMGYHQPVTDHCWGWYATQGEKSGVFSMTGQELLPPTHIEECIDKTFIKSLGMDPKREKRIKKEISFNGIYGNNCKKDLAKILYVGSAIANAPGELAVEEYRGYRWNDKDQELFFIESGGKCFVHQARQNPKSLVIPEFKDFLYKLAPNTTTDNYDNMRFGHATDGSYMAFDISGGFTFAYDSLKNKTGFVLFGNDMAYIAPVFDAYWQNARTFPSALRTFPSDSAKVFYVNADKWDEQEITHKLYSATAGRLILNSPTIGVRKSGTNDQGFLTVVDNGRERTGFITHGQDSLVVLDSLSVLNDMVTDVATRHSNRIVAYQGGQGIIDTKTNNFLAPVLDRITPASNLTGVSVENGEWYITEKNKRYGLAYNATTVLPPVYDKLQVNTDSTLTFTLGSLPAKLRPIQPWEPRDMMDPSKLIFTYHRLSGKKLTINVDYRNGIEGITDNTQELVSDMFGDNYKEVTSCEAALADIIEYTRHYDMMAAVELAFPLAIEKYVTVHTNYGSANKFDVENLEEAIEAYNNLGLDDAVERCEKLMISTEKVVKENLQREEEARSQRELAEQQRQAREQAWRDLANSLSQLSDVINNSFNKNRSSKTTNTKVTVQTPNRRNTSTSQVKSTTTKTTTKSSGNQRQWLGSWYYTYRNLQSRIIQMQVYPEKINLSELKKCQNDMRSTREYINAHGGLQSKSSLEDWRP